MNSVIHCSQMQFCKYVETFRITYSHSKGEARAPMMDLPFIAETFALNLFLSKTLARPSGPFVSTDGTHKVILRRVVFFSGLFMTKLHERGFVPCAPPVRNAWELASCLAWSVCVCVRVRMCAHACRCVRTCVWCVCVFSIMN